MADQDNQHNVILYRKEEHIDLALQDEERRRGALTGFSDFDFEHLALPEINLKDIQLETHFLEKKMNLPCLISSMTGGPTRAEKINIHLAEAAQQLKIGLGVGSQRVSLLQAEEKNGLGKNIRQIAKDIPLIGNIGGAQLIEKKGIENALRAIDQIEADALFVHLNPLQEALQPDGDTNWHGVLTAIQELCSRSTHPIIVKEIGCGISAKVGRQLLNVGVHALDVAGAGGTSWSWIESHRRDPIEAQSFASVFDGWGIPTTKAIKDLRAECPDAIIIGSGGIRNGLEAAKAIHLGADIFAIAGGALQPALKSTQAVINYFKMIEEQLKITCFATGCSSFRNLQTAPVRQVKA